MISRVLLRDLIIMIIVTKFETNLKTYVEIKRYLVQLHIIYFVQTTKVFKQSFTHCINRFQYSFIIIYIYIFTVKSLFLKSLFFVPNINAIAIIVSHSVKFQEISYKTCNMRIKFSYAN